MTRETIPISEIHAGLSPLVGVERARELVSEAVKASGLTERSVYTRDEMAAICVKLKSRGGLISAVVSAMSVRILHA